MDVDDFPILGEPLPVEFANTLYCDDSGGVVDFLATGDLAARWAELVVPEGEPPALAGLDDVALRAIIELRNAVRFLLMAGIEGAVPAKAHVEVVNDAAKLVPTYEALSWSSVDGPRSRTVRQGDWPAKFISTVGDETIQLLGGPECASLRVCGAVDCSMLFLKQHHRRRWCHDSCGHRTRQAAYYRRKHSTQAQGPHAPRA